TCTLALATAATRNAHHTAALLDDDNQTPRTRKLRAFTWQTLHAYIGRDTAAEYANPKHNMIERANHGILNRGGWKFNMIKPGDVITVVVAPLRTGEPGALLKQIKLPDGRKFDNGGPAGPARIPID